LQQPLHVAGSSDIGGARFKERFTAVQENRSVKQSLESRRDQQGTQLSQARKHLALLPETP
jgi:hypothetical protein